MAELKEKAKEVQKEQPKAKISTKEFTLKKPLNGKAIGEKVRLGAKGEKFYKRNKTI